MCFHCMYQCQCSVSAYFLLHALTLNVKDIIQVEHSADWQCKLVAAVMARALRVPHSTLIYAAVLCREIPKFWQGR